MEIEISKCDLDSFLKVSKNTSLSKLTIIVSVFSFLLDKYCEDFQGVIKVYASDQIPLKNKILLDVEKKKEITFKDLLKSFASNIKEAVYHSDYNNNDLDLTKYSNFSIQYGKRPESIKDNLSLFYDESEEKVILNICYKDIYKGYLIDNLLKSLVYILSNYDQLLNTGLIDYPLVSEKEVAEILGRFNLIADYPSDQTIIDLFDSQVRKNSDGLAVIYGDVALSYADLDMESNQLAYYLKNQYDIKADDLICIQLPRNEKMIISILGILKSGGAYVPIDMDYPKDRIDYILTDTKAKVNIDDVFLAKFNEVKHAYSAESHDSAIKGDHLAYVIYTSGTTGNPKGVMIEHQNVFHSTINRIAFYDIESMLLVPSFSFDSSVAAIFGTLCSGGRLFIESNMNIKDVEYISHRIIKNKIEGILCVPNYYSSLLPYLNENTSGENTLKHVIVAGEELSKNLVLNHQKYSDAILYNEYGPTECAVWSSVSIVNDPNVNIGKSIANTQIYILDEHGHLLPVGVHGELYIAGAGLARGYLNREDLTEEKFVANPFVEGTKMYRTGDLGRWLPDGTIEYLGRIDHQVKIRGHRIELGEIDSQVLSYDNCIKFVVTEVKEHEGDKSLVVYYVSNSAIDKQDLAYYLENKLPQYMLPSFYVELEHIPLTSNGKIDRKSLPEVSSSDLIKTEYVAPMTWEEKALVEVCELVLKYNPISISDNYYNLGGDSIKSIQIVSRLRQRGYSLKVEHILQYPVLEELARYMTTDVAVIDQSVVKGEGILTPIQRYFFESEELINKNHYNQSVILKSKERLSGSVLESSIQSLINHHDALRMVYSHKEGGWNQSNAGIEGNHYLFEYFDIREEGSLENEQSSLQKIGARLQSTIDIESGILFHIGHVSMSDGDRLVLVIHHLVVDGVSWRILLEDLGNLYEAGFKGASYELPSKTDSFQSWGKALESYSNSSALSKERLYWEGIESEVYPAIPTDHAAKGKQVLDKSLDFSLSIDSTKLLQTRAGRKYSAEINDVLLTGLALSLQDQFGISKAKVLMEGHGRELMSTGLDISRTVGWFTSVYPFSLDISNKKQPALVSVKEALRSIPHKGIGYGILNYLGDAFSPVNHPSVQFNYLGDFDDTIGSGFYYSSESIGSTVSEENLVTDILLDVSGITMSGAMTISIRYSGELFNEATIQKLTDSYQSYLEKMIGEGEESKVILTPSDLTYKGLSFNTIQEISKNVDIEDIYELSPMQQGLYYHWLVDPKGAAYFMQTSYRIKSENLDLSKVEKAFVKLLNRYTILRTSFDNRYGDIPLQIVYKQAKVDFKHLILESDLELDNIKQGDIACGFDLREPTQMRLLVVELPDNSYEFIWSHHHIIMDGWCLSILINEFSTILNSFQQGIEASLPETQSYSSYIKWLEGVNKEEAITYWKNYLKGINSPTLIPFEKNIKEEKPYFATEKLSIGQDELKEINHLCQQLGITLNTFIQGVWSYLLSSYNRSEDVIFGSVVSGRSAELAGVESMVGLFINTIPVRVSFSKDETPRSLLNKIHQDSINGIKYHFTSLVEVQSLSLLGKELINNIVVFENYAKQGDNEQNSLIMGLSGVNVNVFEQTNYDFTIVAIPDKSSLHIEFRYDSSVFDPSSILSLVSHFEQILHQFVSVSDIPLRELDYVGVEEKAVLASFGNTRTCYPVDKTIVDLFEEQVNRTPDLTALVYKEIKLTYRELNEESNKLAHYLREQYNIEADDLICIQLPRSEKMLIGMLGILKSGGAYVPVDTDYPEERKEYILKDTKSKVVIDESFLLEFETLKRNYSIENPTFTVRSENLAYIIYTSGTTGNPKGAMIEHKNVVRLLFNDDALYNFNSHDSWTLFHSYNFDFSVWECYGALLFGGKLHVISRQVAQDPGAFLNYIIDNKITVLNQTPAAFYNLAEYDKLFNKKELSLRYIIFGGEVLNPIMLRDWQRKYPSIKMMNGYGPTETTVFASKFKIGNDNLLEPATLPIGKPISDTQIYILDSSCNLVPIGVAGELYISGSGLARGYLNREDLTAEKFVSNPFVEGTKMYRTGDLGRWLPDGNIEYLGRIDHQVKIRGHRIELGEIDSQVLSYSEAIKSVVTEVKEHDGDKSLVVYYVSNASVDKQSLAYHLENKLPHFMLPSFYVELDHIPLTNNGKIDRKSLPEVNTSDLIKTEYISAETEEEKALIEVCEGVLKHHPISIRDNYYNLGGDSIKSIQIVSRLRQRGYNLKVEHILQYPIFEELSRYITSDVVLIDQSVIIGSSILTPIQRYFFESEDIVNKNYYNQCVILKSRERLSGPVLESSLQALVSHHDALRMEYHQNYGLWNQYNQGTEGKYYNFEYFDVRGSGGELKELSRLKEIGESLQSSINITSGILFHVGHVSMSDGDRLLLIIHHLVVDGVSWRILLEDLGNLYESGIKGASYELPFKTDSFQSWGTTLEEYSNDSALSKERLYWESVESEVYSSIPTDHPVVRKHTLDKNIGFTLNGEATRLLQTRAGKKYSAEINDVLLTGLALSLQDQFGINKTKVLMEGHGREVLHTGLDISRTVGWFTSVYPFSLDISDRSQPVLVSVKEGLRGIPHKGIGYGILKYLNLGLSSTERPSVQFNYLGDFDDTTDSLFHYTTEDIGYPVSEENQGTDILLDVSGMTVNGEMSINFRYSGNIFNESTVQKLVDSYQIHLEQMIIEDEEQKVILTPSDLTYNRLAFHTIQAISKDCDLEDIYELTPMQQGLYYHWLVDPKGSTYFMQTSYRIKSESLDLSKVEKAFGKLLNRYTILRTSFDNRYGDAPLQIVHKQAKVDFKYQVIESKDSLESDLEMMRNNDIICGFALNDPTQLRLILVGLPDEEYEFIWSYHHIVMDGWCLSILINDFSLILDSLQHEVELSLQEPQKYSSYLKWLRNVDQDSSLQYWENYLKGISAPTLIPFEKNIKGEKPHFATEKFSIGEEELKEIGQLCQQLGITLNTYVQAAWCYLLSSYNASEEIVFGSVVSGRPPDIEGIESMVGLFINTIPVRIKVNKDETPRSLLKKLHQDSIQNTGYHFNSLAEIQSLSPLGKDLISNIVIFENYVKTEKENFENVKVFDQSNYDFTLAIEPNENCLNIDFEYNTSVYCSTIITLASHLKNTLSHFKTFIDQPLSEFNYLSSAEEELLLKDFNNTFVQYPDNQSVVSLFEDQVGLTPEDIAVVYEDLGLSYAELNEKASSLAVQLQSAYGIKKGDQVGVMLNRGENQIISILGILKLGAVYVPVDANLPESRKAVMTSGLSLLITESYYFFDLDFYSGESFSIDLEFTEEDASGFQSVVLEKDDIAYIIYTSGSTGEPKGVLNTHGGILNTMLYQKEFFEVSLYENVAQFASFSFDASISEIFMTLLSGKSLHILNDSTRKDAYAFEEYVNSHSIDLVTLPPAFFSLLNIDKLQNLKGLITAGESAVMGKTKEYLKYGTFYNAYGPTESSICATVYKLEKGSDLEFTTIPIGQPIANTQIYILDEYGHLVPVGVSGEMYISGAGLAEGYLNLEDLTEEKFVDNPFVPGTKMYRTGDLGRWLMDGNIEYLGRIDHQVKIRGHRIELGEIDSQVLSFSDSIKGVVTEVKEHEEDKSLVVYYVSNTPIDKQDLSRYLERKLPQYMLPGFYVELDNIPLTSNGKIDRKNLPEVSTSDLIKNEYVAATNEEGRALISVCEQVLKHSPISILDNYYNLGGDSIKSIQIVSRLRQQGYSLKVEHILQYPILEELARYITTDVVNIDQSAVTGASILTPIQRYFFESDDIVNKNHYNQSVVLRSSERLSGTILESSIKALVSHHDALRMVYSQKDGEWNQYNAGVDGVHYRLEYFDIRKSISESEELSCLQEIGESLQSSIDIASGILFHVGHVSMSDGDRIILVVHHLVMDGVSWRILLEDLGKLYESGVQGLSSDLPSKTDSFQSWGKALEEYSRSAKLSKEHLYWEGIESANYVAIATDYPTEGKHILDKSIGFSLSAESTKLLQTRAGRKYSAEINDILLTGLALSLHENFGINKTKVLMEGHGREVLHKGLDISRTLGWFTSVYPFSLDISSENQPSLVSVKEGLRGIPHKGIGYGILKYLGQGLSSAEHPSVQFNYLGDFDDTTGSLFHYTTEDIGYPVSKDNQKSDILLDVSGMTVNGEMSINIRYSDKVFHQSTVQKLVDSYQIHLEQMIIEDEEQKVILTPSDLTYKRLPFRSIQEISKYNEVEDIYELSPMQQGLYYHWLVDPKGSAYFMQTSYRIKSESLDLSKVEKAFGKLLNRYTILRTSFDNHYGDVPLQIVNKQAKVDFKHLILESDLELDNIKKGDIARGFDLNEPTQMRLLVVELPDNSYEFIWSHHHIIMDGWCLSILINDFSAILNSLQQGLSLSLSEPEKYSSYIKWLEEVDKEQAMVYWENYLKGISSPTLIPFEKQDQGEVSHYLAETLVIENNDFQEVDRFCQYLGITLNTYVQGVWSYLLSSYNRSEDVVFGSVVSGRPADLEGVENMIGLFINTIPVRVSFDKDETPRSLLNKLHQDSIQSTGNHFSSLAEIQSLSSLGKDLINNIIIFENYVRKEDQEMLTGIVYENTEAFEHTNYNLNIVVIPNTDSLHIEFRYNSSVYDTSAVTSILLHFQNIMNSFRDSLDLQVSEITYLGAEERNLVLKGFNTTEAFYPSETILSLFAKQVNHIPNHTALISDYVKLTYNELNSESNQLVHYLQEKYAITANDLIAIQLPRNEKMIISILGVLKSRGAYVPIDMNHPQERTEYILEDTQSKVFIDEKFWKEFSVHRDNYSTEDPIVKLDPSNLAYVIYTSGTTGNPKGVCISHSNLMNYVCWSNQYYFNNEDRGNWGLFTSISFDLSVTALFCSLTRGGSLWLGEGEEDILTTLIKAFKNRDIDILKLTPSHISLLKNVEIHHTGIRKIILGGEKLYHEHIQIIHSINKNIQIYDEYGPTEATVGCIAQKVDLFAASIGRPISNTGIYILEEYGNVVPVGVSGELYITGSGLAQGYLNNKDLTAEKFVDNPFVKDAKMYRTGDLGRWLPDGTIEYLGRIDDQVKIHGHRIELGEIDSQVLSYHKTIRNTVADVKEYNGDKILVVYYTTDEIIDKQSLSGYLKNKLPQYMLPSFYVELDSIPLTSNGKIDRKSLPEVSSEDMIRNEYVAAKTEMDHLLMDSLSQLLNNDVKKVSIHDNFFDMGLNSLSLVRFSQLLRKDAGLEIEIAKFFSYPTISELSKFIQNMNITTAETNTAEDKDLSDHIDSFIDDFN
ncbi:amino acid adenylation domain-containing protein [Chryseobacterium gambrini]|uniref:Non-ribosomal peptide synthetase n=1 Tax=Chryseobacterium gambrini TaxID=373672 RepID=A0ABN7C8Z8_9FLAO|nr:non-ribosomal peptide synthetase [Chryseobacterium gambrini]